MALSYTSATTIIYNNLSNGGIIHRTSGFVQLIANQGVRSDFGTNPET
jgi:hypothetical protein